MNRYMASVRQSLFIQAAITAFFLLLPSGTVESHLREVTLVLALVTAVLGVLVSMGLPNTYWMVVAWEAIAVGVGALSLTKGYYIPGSIVAVALLIRLLDANFKAGFLAGAAAPPPAPAPVQPPYAMQQPAYVPPAYAPPPAAPYGSWPPPPPSGPPSL
ncbi:hypothetical protein acdb102_06080 [Acidothermaceae bacterium B102]|nr:hypothetical protein acdb102_06080 [Acidothermaceae bacterium B102]